VFAVFLVHFVEFVFCIHSTSAFLKLMGLLLFPGNYLSLVELVSLFVTFPPIEYPPSTLMKTSSI
jgi:hypothetical protein